MWVGVGVCMHVQLCIDYIGECKDGLTFVVVNGDCKFKCYKLLWVYSDYGVFYFSRWFNL